MSMNGLKNPKKMCLDLKIFIFGEMLKLMKKQIKFFHLQIGYLSSDSAHGDGQKRDNNFITINITSDNPT